MNISEYISILLDSCKTLDCIVLWRKDTQLYRLINSILLADVYQILFILPYISILYVRRKYWISKFKNCYIDQNNVDKCKHIYKVWFVFHRLSIIDFWYDIFFMESFYNLILITRIPNGGKSILLYTVYNETTIHVFNSNFIVHRFCNTSIEKNILENCYDVF